VPANNFVDSGFRIIGEIIRVNLTHSGYSDRGKRK
jgi:hypothetical protein